MANDELLHKWIAGTISEKELKTFQSRPEYPQLVELYKNTEHLTVPEFDQEEVLSHILRQPKSQLRVEKRGRRIFLKNWKKYAVAASILLLAGWLFWQYDDGLTRHQMAAGESMEALLPDESIFYLNAGSSIVYDEKNWANDRTLSLKGEAFFEVKKGSTFTVETPNGKIQVLGTEFNVWSREGILEVKCQSGKVAVYDANGKKVGELMANDAIRISLKNKTEKWQTNSVASWREGISKFRDVSLALVLDELERQYDLKVKRGNVNTDEIISCNFPHGDIDLALKSILSPLSIDYEIVDEKTVELFSSQ